DQADAILAKDARREIVDDHLVAEALGDVARGDDQRAGLLRFADLDHGAAGGTDLLAPLLAQFAERPQPAFVAGAARADALAGPFGLALDQPVELVPLGRLALEDGGRPLLEGVVAPVEPPHAAAIKPQHGARQVREKPAIVAHQYVGTLPVQ